MKRRKRGRTLGDTTISQLPNPAGGVRIQTFVPWTLVNRRNKKQVITPLGPPEKFWSEAIQECAENDDRKDSALIRVLGQAYYWQWLLDERHVNSLSEIARAEEIDVTYIRRLIRLTLLAPSYVEELFKGSHIRVSDLMRLKVSNVWANQFT